MLCLSGDIIVDNMIFYSLVSYIFFALILGAIIFDKKISAVILWGLFFLFRVAVEIGADNWDVYTTVKIFSAISCFVCAWYLYAKNTKG